MRNTGSKQWDTTNIPIRMVKLTTPNAGEDVKQLEFSFQADRNAYLAVSNKTLLPYDPEIMLPDTYPKEVKIYIHIKAYTWMFTGVLFITAKTWKQSTRHPSVGEWINTWYYIQTTHYSVLKEKRAIKPWKDMEET